MLTFTRGPRVIEVLRRMYPKYTWSYDAKSREWRPAGQEWFVHAYAHGWASPYGNYYTTEYRRSDTGDLVFLGRTWPE